MNWGEVITAVRDAHAEFLNVFSLRPESFLRDIELNHHGFPFPQDSGDYADWEPSERSPELQTALETHPVERILLEGPLLPIQCLHFSNGAQGEQEFDFLLAAILRLEQEWLEKSGFSAPSHFPVLQKLLQGKWAELKARHSLGKAGRSSGIRLLKG